MSERDRVRAGLAEFHVAIAKIIDLAWQEDRLVRRLRGDAGISPPLYRRTGSNNIFDGVARYAMRELGSHPRVRVRPEKQTVKFLFANKALGSGVLARFKQGDENKLSRSTLTQAVMDFLDPEALPYRDLPPDTVKVEVVWIPNSLRTDYDAVHIVARDGKNILWDYPVDRWQGSSDVVHVHRPTPPDHGDEDMRKLVVPKGPAEVADSDADK